jgi:NTP pyrophosphatase (non-canonical NTP hydrolase)
MTFEEFQRFIDKESEFLDSLDPNAPHMQGVFARTVKLGEEYGELCDEVLGAAKYQREEKTADSRNLEGEFADVVITAFLLARKLGVDMPQALAAKIEVIKSRQPEYFQENHG